jgi:hypothetical protein
MAAFIFTSPLFKGFMHFEYDEEDVLIKFENNATIDLVQLKYLQGHFPFVLQDLDKIKGAHGKFEEHVDITFDTFWNNYDYKRGKVSAQSQWNKLSDEAKHKAIQYIPKYKFSMKTKGQELLYAERYIKFRRFDDE